MTNAGVMYTCDAFGMHYCDHEVFDTELEVLSPHLRFYYDCLMKPNARSVLTALRKVSDLDFNTIATGHGPLLRYNVPEIVGRQATGHIRLQCHDFHGVPCLPGIRDCEACAMPSFALLGRPDFLSHVQFSGLKVARIWGPQRHV